MPPAAPRTATLADEAVVLENDRAVVPETTRPMTLVARRLKIILMYLVYVDCCSQSTIVDGVFSIFHRMERLIFYSI